MFAEVVAVVPCRGPRGCGRCDDSWGRRVTERTVLHLLPALPRMFESLGGVMRSSLVSPRDDDDNVDDPNHRPGRIPPFHILSCDDRSRMVRCRGRNEGVCDRSIDGSTSLCSLFWVSRQHSDVCVCVLCK